MAHVELKRADSPAAAQPLRIIMAGKTGSGKSAQIWTLPGKKFVYCFDPNTMPTIHGCPDCDVVEFMPDALELDATLKGFNKGAKDDKIRTKREPTLYMRWIEHFNAFVDGELPYKLSDYNWLVFDSLTFIAKAVMDRQLFINGRYGAIEDLADYRVVGSKLTDVFSSISGLPINVFCTAHLTEYQDELTKRIVTQLFLPGKARNMLPLSHTEVWLAEAAEGHYFIRTMPDKRGLQDIRTSIKGLKEVEDVTIKDFSKAQKFGIGALISRR